MVREVPEYAKTPEGKENWVQREKVTERTKYYTQELYNETVHSRAKKKVAEVFADVESNVNLGGEGNQREIVKGDTLGQILLDTVCKGNYDLMKQALKNLQAAGFQVDLIHAGDTLKIENNRLTITTKEGEVRKDRDTGNELKDLKVFDMGAAEGGPGESEPPVDDEVPEELEEKLTPDEQFQNDWEKKEAQMREVLNELNQLEDGAALDPPLTMDVVEVHGRRGNSKEITLHRGGLQEKMRVTILFWGHTEYRDQVMDRFHRNVDNLMARYERKDVRYEEKEGRQADRRAKKTTRLEEKADEAAEGKTNKALRKEQRGMRVEERFDRKKARLDKKQEKLSTPVPPEEPEANESLDEELKSYYKAELTQKVKDVFQRKFDKEVDPHIHFDGHFNPTTDRWDVTVTYDLRVDGVSKSTGELHYEEEKAFKKLRFLRVANDIIRENGDEEGMANQLG